MRVVIQPISVPRIKRADDIDPDVFDNGLSDELFAKVIACIRIAVPYTGMIISTRESQQVRERALGLGISQISGASRTSVGGYEEGKAPLMNISRERQFSPGFPLFTQFTMPLKRLIALVGFSFNNAQYNVL